MELQLEYWLLMAIFGLAFLPATYKACRFTCLPELLAWWRAPHCTCCKRKKKKPKAVVPVAKKGRARFVVAPARVTNELTEQAGAVGRSARNARQGGAIGPGGGHPYSARPSRMQFNSLDEAEDLEERIRIKSEAERKYLFETTSQSRTCKDARRHIAKREHEEAAKAKAKADRKAAADTAWLFRKNKPLPLRPETPPEAVERRERLATEFMHTMGAVDAGRITLEDLEAYNSRAQ